MMLEISNLQNFIPERNFRAEATRRSESRHFINRKRTLRQNREHFTANISCGTDDCDLEPHNDNPVWF